MSQQILTPAERIHELSAINEDIPVLLSSAGKAIEALTNRPLKVNEDAMDGEGSGMDKSASVTAHKEAFTENAKAYFINLQSIMARLRRQAYALEEAGIITAEAPALSTAGQNGNSTQQPGAGPAARRGVPGMAGAATQRQPADDGDRITNGGLGNLDVGLLNSRGNSVGMEKEAELMAEAKDLLKGLLNKSGRSEG